MNNQCEPRVNGRQAEQLPNPRIDDNDDGKHQSAGTYHTQPQTIDELRRVLSERLLAARSPSGLWEGHLSSSAISTSLACSAFLLADPIHYKTEIQSALAFLKRTQLQGMQWGDSPESPPNPTATLLAKVALQAERLFRSPSKEATGDDDDRLPTNEKEGDFPLVKNQSGVDDAQHEGLKERANRSEDTASFRINAKEIRQIYGRDLTFSGPLLALCAIFGVTDWREVPRFPFELALLPRAFYRFLDLPVVSYAIPALIAVGITKGKRSPFVALALRKLEALQPENGGFLEAVPLTAFVSICLMHAGFKEHVVVKRGLAFIQQSIRCQPVVAFAIQAQEDLVKGDGTIVTQEHERSSLIDGVCSAPLKEELAGDGDGFLAPQEEGFWVADGGFPIDTNLQLWLTSLAIRALGRDAFSTQERGSLIRKLLEAQQAKEHPFNGALPGGWGWTSLAGAVPDADDTSAALMALHTLGAPYSKDIEKGIEWLLDLQNQDGGIPTFCRGWGKLPFDRSSPEISSHAFAVILAWLPQFAVVSSVQQAKRIRKRSERTLLKILTFLRRVQRDDGAWLPLWFGDQDVSHLTAPCYGTATVLCHLLPALKSDFTALTPLRTVLDDVIHRAGHYLLTHSNEDGGFAGDQGAPSKVIYTAQALRALRLYRAYSFPAGEDFPLHCLANENASQSQTAALTDCEQRSRCDSLINQAQRFLLTHYPAPAEPVGLYFAKLWYSERLYPLIFSLGALS